MEDDDMDESPDRGMSKRAKAQRQRVHISEQYERKIDRIEDRLAGIENVLASLSSKLGNMDLAKDSPETGSQSRSSRAGRSPGSGLQEAPTPAPFEGESSINIQSVYAREMLAQVIDNTPSIGQNEEVKMALTALSEMVSQPGQTMAPSNRLINRSLTEVDPTRLEQPPWMEVCNALDTAMKYSTMTFAVIFPFLKMPNLREIFDDVYHNPGTCSATRRVLTYGILQNIFYEFQAFPLAGMDISQYATYAAICKRQTEVALSQLDLFIPASYENIMALVLGAAQAIEMCKPSLCYILVSCAAGLCTSLGYHRINTMSHDTPEEKESKIYIFWMIYMFDKTLSLRLGKSSVLQDWDIALPFVHESDPNETPSQRTRMLSYWVKVARVQGLTYEKLFCPASFLQSTEERTAVATDLINAMNQAWAERHDVKAVNRANFGKNINNVPQRVVGVAHSPNKTPLPSQLKRYISQPLNKECDANEYIQGALDRVEDILFYSDVVSHYSTCALIQRSVSPGNMTFNQDCLQSSRSALDAHKRASAQFNKKGQEELWSGYVHWSILQAPFTPFIVIFCNAIQKADTTDVSADLQSLSEFVTSLESCRTISEGAEKLYRMCHLFLRVARLYVTAKAQDAALRSRTAAQNHQNYYTANGAQLDLNAMSQFDPYLNALGLLPDTAWSANEYNMNPAGPGGMQAFPQDQQMGNSFNQGQMGLGFGPPGGTHNSMQDWFSGSIYLMNLMEPGDDMQMPDMDL
ncbi:hypothetical protein COCC4DRAFT_146409 [Bipolaris maydis ATCC 48331]|uniref:Xylanolytic transcriptional activator regulatory domain-containing protein n=2 Tax=Cochliobolus heterostrophus TaxID=5016 RepID=M2THJ8_COCH5|nr:uncharacterized protein COCC4DRAFT_146409 [Bipolaris maydis ATCC 48331]EMD85979.1 hypothetical protein COCHEDRAFT_1116731 [Bipolaris maydis C5]KAJ5063015.1 hypothetical protein J3E74DRAFT_266627 [Bipolaris maydis]ENI01982.1 hypothetical protein COCC4DRAFT_146409 [Bipolaris maydis ATCC 48331]KAJ6199285.1 hypothetical protein J3E72DRAFT_240139 [Bipolaris maydis]KAJ6203985.1 hypothetical protein PSV09DRAFT_1116731 [Bipolaris maydis]